MSGLTLSPAMLYIPCTHHPPLSFTPLVLLVYRLSVLHELGGLTHDCATHMRDTIASTQVRVPPVVLCYTCHSLSLRGYLSSDKCMTLNKSVC